MSLATPLIYTPIFSTQPLKPSETTGSVDEEYLKVISNIMNVMDSNKQNKQKEQIINNVAKEIILDE